MDTKKYNDNVDKRSWNEIAMGRAKKEAYTPESMENKQPSVLEQYRDKMVINAIFPHRPNDKLDYPTGYKDGHKEGFTIAIILMKKFNKWMKDPEIDPKYFENIPKTRENLLGYFVTHIYKLE